MSTNAPQWTHLVRFIAVEDHKVHLGQIDPSLYPDVGLALLEEQKVTAKIISGDIFSGTITDKEFQILKLLSPLKMNMVPIVRCLGLNYKDHAREISMPIPRYPVVFLKPRHTIAGPYPERIVIPPIAQDGTSDYEAELALVISKTGKDIPEHDAMQYILGFTCANDVSARKWQFIDSQWCFSKGFDGSAPIGPVLVSPTALPDPSELAVTAKLNGLSVQDTNTKEMIFKIPKIISFLSQGTTLEQGTVILTGTGPGIGAMRKPPLSLKDGDLIQVHIESIGTLVNQVCYA